MIWSVLICYDEVMSFDVTWYVMVFYVMIKSDLCSDVIWYDMMRDNNVILYYMIWYMMRDKIVIWYDMLSYVMTYEVMSFDVASCGMIF